MFETIVSDAQYLSCPVCENNFRSVVMKRKTLTTAVMAGLTGVAGMMSVANAVNVNPDGLGQVLLYPYYTTRGGNDTLISVVNTTSEAKSVKIRFLEGRNSREVLDFNIYMSEFDVWTGFLQAEGDGAKLVTTDTTCTVPYFVGDAADGVGEVELRDFEFIDFEGLSPENVDGAGTDIERVKSGYFEILEMGTLIDETNGSATAATHVNGVPEDCQQLVDAWTTLQDGTTPADEDAYWAENSLVDHDTPTGGLFGSASIININEGTLLSYNATAIDNWTTSVSHTNSGFVTPRVIDGSITTSAVFRSNSQTVDQQSWANSRDAFNAVLMNNRIANEYAINPAIGGLTEWVLTFPTKRFSVDPLIIGAMGEPIAPFSVLFEGTSCEPVTFRLWDREEIERTEDEPGTLPPRPSPLPPDPDPEIDTFDLCYEANVVRFARASTDTNPTETEIFGENRFITLPLADNFISGWTEFNFDPEEIPAGLMFPADARTISNGAVNYVGLPVIGFQATTVSNDTLVVDGQSVLSNYGGTFNHRGSRRIELVSP
ncbi:MAG TPA: hypothetical protein VKO85_08705 [Wenzhouxiangellaceae bacterium]|nr:hypothetical protein [Wenzhouxiangellaceae bacterium]